VGTPTARAFARPVGFAHPTAFAETSSEML